MFARLGANSGCATCWKAACGAPEIASATAAQLIDAVSGGHLWAEKYDYDYADIFALQDRITESVVAAIEPEILVNEGRRAARQSPTNLGAFDCCMRGMWHSNQLGPRSTVNRPRAGYAVRSSSIRCSPELMSMLARVLSVRCWAGYSDDIDRDLAGKSKRRRSGPWRSTIATLLVTTRFRS